MLVSIFSIGKDMKKKTLHKNRHQHSSGVMSSVDRNEKKKKENVILYGRNMEFTI